MNEDRRDEQPQPAHEAHGGPTDAPPLSGRVAGILILILLILAVVVAVAGIVPRVRARNKLVEQTDALAAPDVLVKPPVAGKTGREIILPGNVYAYSRCFALCAHRRLSKQVVFRHRRTRPKGAAAGGHQCAGSGQATASGARRFGHCGGQCRIGENELDPLSGSADARRGFKTGHRHLHQPGGFYQLGGKVCPSQCSTSAGAAIL